MFSPIAMLWAVPPLRAPRQVTRVPLVRASCKRRCPALAVVFGIQAPCLATATLVLEGKVACSQQTAVVKDRPVRMGLHVRVTQATVAIDAMCSATLPQLAVEMVAVGRLASVCVTLATLAPTVRLSAAGRELVRTTNVCATAVPLVPTAS